MDGQNITFGRQPHPDQDAFEYFRRYAVLHLLQIWLAGPLERETLRNGFQPVQGGDSDDRADHGRNRSGIPGHDYSVTH
jgi:hypothetical protein